MGLFDRFRKKEPEVKQSQQYENPFEVEIKMINDRIIQIDFYDKNADFKQFYNMTRLIASYTPTNFGKNRDVLSCKVSWYGRQDAEILNEKDGNIGGKEQYRGVLAQIDLNLLQTDKDYCYIVMKELLNKNRVERYLDSGLEENPETPCGKYIGGIKPEENGYKKVFDTSIGIESHNSDLMVKRRREYIENQKMKRQHQGQINGIEER